MGVKSLDPNLEVGTPSPGSSVSYAQRLQAGPPLPVVLYPHRDPTFLAVPCSFILHVNDVNIFPSI